MSFPPPNSGQYPYIPHPQYQSGHVPPPQLIYNNVATPSPSPYNNGYGKPPAYPPGMMPYPSAYQEFLQQHQPQQHMQPPQLQQSPLIHQQQQLQPQPQPRIPQPHQQQQSPRPRPQQPLLPHTQPQSPMISHAQHQSPRPLPQQQSYIQPHQSPILQQPRQLQSPRQQQQQHSYIQPRQSPILQQPQSLQSPRQQQQQQQQQQQPYIQPRQSPIIQQTEQLQSPRLRPPQSPVQKAQRQQSISRPAPNKPPPVKQSPVQQPRVQQPQAQQSQVQQPQVQQPQVQQPQVQQPQVQQSQIPQSHVQQPQLQQSQVPQSHVQLSQVQQSQAQQSQVQQSHIQQSHVQQPPSLPPSEPAHQFVNPANLFVEPPLPLAPRSWYTSSSQYVDPSALTSSSAVDLPLVPLPTTSSPSLPQPPLAQSAPIAQIALPASPPSNPQPLQGQSSFQIPQTVKAEKHPPPTPKQTPASKQTLTLKQTPTPKPPSTPKVSAPSELPHPKSTSLPVVHAIPQVLVPAPSPDFRISMQKQQPQKPPQPKKQPSQKTGDKVMKSNKPPVDYQVLLLSLADEYLNAAHRQGTQTALLSHPADVEEYYKLVSTGLGCLEAVLKNWRLAPRKEALVRLRYARTLFEETENDIEAETALSKGIDLCERNRMLDLKYSMQHLLARMLHKTNPKASLKAVDGMIQDVEAYRHAAWEYAFRFLRVSLSLSSPSHQDSVQALQHLNKISTMATRNGDKAVSAMAAVIEALAHLQQGGSSDSIEQAQRAVAIARSHQLNDELRHIPQLVTLIQMVDICCSILEYDVNQSAQKLKVMQSLVDETLSNSNWRSDGSFSVPLNGKSAGPSSIDTGDILQVESGTLLLSFNWLPQHDLYALSYFLSSITLSAKNSYDGRKAEKYLDEGLRMIQGSFTAPQEIPESMANAARRVEWRRSLYCSFLLQRVFLACSRTDWDMASTSLKELRQVVQDIGPNIPKPVECLMEYAAGTIAQATGDLAGAFNIFQSPLLSLSPSASKTTRNDPCRDTSILAALNTVLLIRDPAHPSHSHLPTVMATLESFCSSSPNKYIQAAYFLVCATVQTESTIQTKQYLQQALQSATAISNSQITCMTLTFMSWKYFRGVVGEQAEKSARAGRAMAKRANDRLWASVTDEMLADTLERQGKGDEAQGVREEGQRLIMGLPPGLKRPA
ncbi:uncharacterized protein N7503_003667 [Penicillium pulvis]|uniref:uncharacterized protein n=1 Tax=Penicillium pulvis TaxID=1562058 RepID=UPI0025496335|nr:uncharacterized protein N7503_003667 [Penicillium pulvis]KAJ5806065.1 hypothetical protein N7503_003667 [Penicillium pulvis]